MNQMMNQSEITCPHGSDAHGWHTAVFEELPDGYATKRWGGARKEEPYLRCPVCTATFPAWAIEELLQK
jgi:hypothetical protein